MVTCNACGREARFGSDEWKHVEQGKTIDPPILVVECPGCGEIVDMRVEL